MGSDFLYPEFAGCRLSGTSNRPYGAGLMSCSFRAMNCLATLIQSRRDGTDVARFQAINCVATVIQALRDKACCAPSDGGGTLRLYRALCVMLFRFP